MSTYNAPDKNPGEDFSSAEHNQLKGAVNDNHTRLGNTETLTQPLNQLARTSQMAIYPDHAAAKAAGVQAGEFYLEGQAGKGSLKIAIAQ